MVHYKFEDLEKGIINDISKLQRDVNSTNLKDVEQDDKCAGIYGGHNSIGNHGRNPKRGIRDMCAQYAKSFNQKSLPKEWSWNQSGYPVSGMKNENSEANITVEDTLPKMVVFGSDSSDESDAIGEESDNDEWVDYLGRGESWHKRGKIVSNFTNNKSIKVISDYMLRKYQLWLWDFDDTLIDTASYYRNNMNPDDIRRRTDAELDIEFPSWRYFSDLVIYLGINGIKVGIVSFGTYEIIRAYMDRVVGFNQRIFNKKNILALCRDEKGNILEYKPDKNDFIKQLMDFYKIVEVSNVVLFDDRMTNVAQAAKLGADAILIPGRPDMTGNWSLDRDYMANQSTKSDTRFFGPHTIDKLQNQLLRRRCDRAKQENPMDKIGSIGNRKVSVRERKNIFKKNKDEKDSTSISAASTENIRESRLIDSGSVFEGFHSACGCNSKTRFIFILFLVLAIYFFMF